MKRLAETAVVQRLTGSLAGTTSRNFGLWEIASAVLPFAVCKSFNPFQSLYELVSKSVLIFWSDKMQIQNDDSMFQAKVGQSHKC